MCISISLRECSTRRRIPLIEVPARIRGLIFDCDGTLVDSMPLHMRAWEYAIAKAGTAWDYDFFYSKKGMEEKEIVDEYNREFSTGLDSSATVRVKTSSFDPSHRSSNRFEELSMSRCAIETSCRWPWHPAVRGNMFISNSKPSASNTCSQ